MEAEMKSKILYTVVVIAAVLCCAVLFVQAQESRRITGNQSPSGERFKIVSADVMLQQWAGEQPTSMESPAKAVFLVDTQTGQTWRYESPHTFKKSDGTNSMSVEQWISVSFPENPSGR